MDKSSKYFTHLREILHLVDRNALFKLYGMVVQYYEEHPLAGSGMILWGNLQVLFESHKGGTGAGVWADQQQWVIRSWRIFPFSGVHKMLKHKLEVEIDVIGNDMTYVEQLIQFIKNQAIMLESIESSMDLTLSGPRLDADFLVADSTHMKVAFGVGFKMIAVPSSGIVTTSRYVVPTGRVKVPAGRRKDLSRARPTDHLGKFNGKADDGFFVGYSLNSKAFRVFNSRTRIVEENLHIRFSKSKPNIVGSGPDWLFDINALTRTMNYKPIIAGTQSNGFIGTKVSDNAGQARKEIKPVKDYILLPLWTTDPPFSQNPKSSQDDGSKPSSDDGNKVDEAPRKENECNNQEKGDNVNSTNNVNAASINEVNAGDAKTSIELPGYPNMPVLEDYSIFDFSRSDEDDDAEADMNNLDTTIQVSPNPTIRIHKDHPIDQVIGDLQSATQTRRMPKNLEEHGFVSTIQQRTNHKDLQNYLFACFLS
ncbi:hypothetical protein Tco_0174586 [Tanacetum coccineum]